MIEFGRPSKRHILPWAPRPPENKDAMYHHNPTRDPHRGTGQGRPELRHVPVADVVPFESPGYVPLRDDLGDSRMAGGPP